MTCLPWFWSIWSRIDHKLEPAAVWDHTPSKKTNLYSEISWGTCCVVPCTVMLNLNFCSKYFGPSILDFKFEINEISKPDFQKLLDSKIVQKFLWSLAPKLKFLNFQTRRKNSWRIQFPPFMLAKLWSENSKSFLELALE